MDFSVEERVVVETMADKVHKESHSGSCRYKRFGMLFLLERPKKRYLLNAEGWVVKSLNGLLICD